MIYSSELKVLLEVKNSRNQPLAVVDCLKKFLKIGLNPKTKKQSKFNLIGDGK